MFISSDLRNKNFTLTKVETLRVDGIYKERSQFKGNFGPCTEPTPFTKDQYCLSHIINIALRKRQFPRLIDPSK